MIISTFCSATVVKVDQGKLKGELVGNSGIHRFAGIPFAKPPVGEMRWKAPADPDPWSGVRDATQFGPRAMQTFIFSDMRFRSPGISEDCLYLNVWTPDIKPEAPLPVLVYFHGGGWIAGSGDEPRYDGTAMAQEGIIVVTVNYRMNVFGLLAHPELSAENSDGSSGNYTFLDQVKALQWVHDNISAFGGSPDKITIGGESAGSMSVSLLMVSPMSQKLIAGGIGQSGATIFPTRYPVPQSEANARGEAFLESIGLDSIEEARNMDAEQLLELCQKKNSFSFPPVLDGVFLQSGVYKSLQNRHVADVPLLAGWTSAELPAVAFMQGNPMTSEAFAKQVSKRFENDADAILELYPHADAEQVEQSATYLASDPFVVASTRVWLRLQAAANKSPVYQYLYAQLMPDAVEPTERDFEPLGAPHACDIEYAMGNLDQNPVYAWTEGDYQTSDTMMHFFVNFVKTGNPNGGQLPQWPQLELEGYPTIMRIDAQSEAIACPNEARLSGLERIYGSEIK